MSGREPSSWRQRGMWMQRLLERDALGVQTRPWRGVLGLCAVVFLLGLLPYIALARVVDGFTAVPTDHPALDAVPR